MKKKVPKKPTDKEEKDSLMYGILCGILWVILFIASIHLFTYYINNWVTKGFFYQENLNIDVYLIIGAFLFLVVYKDHAKKIFGGK